jgi:hypothetical protein
VGNAVFFDMLTNTAVDAKDSESVLVKTTGLERLRITGDAFHSGRWNKTDTICYSEEKESSERKTLSWTHI